MKNNYNMKIAYTVDSYHPTANGINTFVDAAVRYLTNLGHEVILLAPDYPHLEDEGPLKGKIPIQRIPSWGVWPISSNRYERLASPLAYKKVKRILDEFKPDIIHVNMEMNLGFLARRYALKHSVPIVGTAHTYLPPYMKIYIKWVPPFIFDWGVPLISRHFYHALDAVHTPTKEMVDVLVNDYKLTIPVKVATIGIDTYDFDGIEREKERENSLYFEKYPRLKERKRLLHVGRIGREKNVEFLFKVLGELLKKRTDVELILAGQSSFMENYQREVAQLGLSEHVTFLGRVSHSDIKNVYALADVFTFASVTETQGMVTTEAIYCGIPTVAVEALGSCTILEGDQGGFLVKEDVGEFAGKVELLLNDPALYAQKQAEARARGAEFSFEKTGKILEETYQEVLANRRKVLG
jgi:glycosyltransferase involved in cell wall biosynthesis